MTEEEDETFRQLPKACQLLIEFARERGIIGKDREDERDAKQAEL